jgi:hypothetical protein
MHPAVTDPSPTTAPATSATSVLPKSGGDRTVRPLPVIAFSVICVTIAGIVYLGRGATRRPTHPSTALQRPAVGDPAPVRDVDHYVPGSPPAVAERFLRAWMRGRYEDVRDVSAGPMRERAEHEIAEVAAFNAQQMEEYRRTRVYTDATNVDLEHIEMRDLPPTPDGRPRKEVRGQGHSYAQFPGTEVDSRRGQTFVLEMVDGAWRVSERTWETFE